MKQLAERIFEKNIDLLLLVASYGAIRRALKAAKRIRELDEAVPIVMAHEKGSFTGADFLSVGKLQLADGGTVFLDEIGDMSLSHQAKILRTIENKEIQRLGGKQNIPLNIKIITATNQDIERMVEDGKFRKDLYYRLNVMNINIPPLRERKEDIPPLLNFFIGKLNGAYRKEVKGVAGETVKDLLGYHWPGNVREMKNMLESSFMNFPARWITLKDLPERFRAKVMQPGAHCCNEKDRVLQALAATKWNKSKVDSLYRNFKVGTRRPCPCACKQSQG